MEQPFVRAAVGAQNLKDLGMHVTWNRTLLELVLGNMPQLEALHIWGDIENTENMIQDSGDRLRALVPILAQFPSLSKITLPPSSELGLGFDGGPMCGNSYFGLQGRKYARFVKREDIWATQTAASIVLLGSPHLNSITIGQWTTIGIDRGKAEWPWTGKIKEYLIGIYPRYRRGEDPGGDDDDEDPEGPIFGGLALDDAALSDDWDPRVCLKQDIDQLFAEKLDDEDI
ncbi:hypothetical protein G7Z17_g5780 [Cylindrodendrum hubeiense]|uniref:Uncharacterized protein n=1 Tax=Cylindrodendrum hubeiense TaxID=595255 RepID=A0A9P5LGZ9_9HYPO|nr:hypothetical protein G7Z17_g5780 [Cylindrodendrum hubeiense]